MKSAPSSITHTLTTLRSKSLHPLIKSLRSCGEMYSSSSSSSFPYLEGRWGTTDNFSVSFFHFPLFSTALWDFGELQACPFPDVVFPPLPLSALSSFPFHCKIVLARPDEQETCPYHRSLRLLTMVRRSSCGPIACWIFAGTSSLREMRSIMR